jgi:hypothetical protein
MPDGLSDEAGTGLVPQSAAKLASDRRRSGLSPAASSSCAAPMWPMGWSSVRRRWVRVRRRWRRHVSRSGSTSQSPREHSLANGAGHTKRGNKYLRTLLMPSNLGLPPVVAGHVRARPRDRERGKNCARHRRPPPAPLRSVRQYRGWSSVALRSRLCEPRQQIRHRMPRSVDPARATAPACHRSTGGCAAEWQGRGIASVQRERKILLQPASPCATAHPPAALTLGARVIETVSRVRLAFAAACPDATLIRHMALTLIPAGPRKQAAAIAPITHPSNSSAYPTQPTNRRNRPPR